MRRSLLIFLLWNRRDKLNVIGLIGIFTGVIAIIYFSLRKLNIVIGAPLAALIVIILNRMSIFEFFLGAENSYLSSFANFIIENFAIFFLGAILGQYMQKSKATISISNAILKVIGTEKPFQALIGILAITAFLTYGGISLFIIFFTIYPIAKPVFKKLDINWSLVYAPVFLGATTFTMTMLPGTPTIHNVIPTQVLGTNLTAAPGLGLLATFVTLVFGLIYMKLELDKSIKNGEGFYSYLGDKKISKYKTQEVNTEEEKTPPIILSILPIIILITLILQFKNLDNIILIALASAVMVAAISLQKYITSNLEVLNHSSANAVDSIFINGSSAAFGTVLILTPAFLTIQNLVSLIPGSPLIGLSILTSLLSSFTGSSVGAIDIVISNYIESYLALGYDPAALHRLVVISSGIFSCMPQTGVVITSNHLTGLSYKNGFKHAFILVNGSHILATVVILLAINYFY